MVCAPVHLAGKLSQQLQVVRGHHHQCAGFTDAVQKFCNGMSGFRIQVSGRLIRKDYLRRVEHCTRNHNALLLTTRQFIGQLIPFVAHPHQVQHLFYFVLNLPFALPTGSTENKFKIVVHRTVCQQLEVLEYDSQFAAQLWDVLTLNMEHVIPQYLSLARCNIQFTIESLEQARLARTHFTYQVHELPFVKFQIHTVQYAQLLLVYLYVRISYQRLAHPYFNF